MKVGGIRTPYLDIVVRVGKLTKTMRIELFNLLSKQLDLSINEIEKLAKKDAIDIQLTDGLPQKETENALEIQVEERIQTKDKFGG